MTIWQKRFGLVPPAQLGSAVSGLGNLAGTADTVLGLAETAASLAGTFYSQNVDPAAAASQLLVSQVKDLINDVFSAGGYKIIAHPFIPGVGQGTGVFRSLSFPNCIDVICREFDDMGDKQRPVFSSATEVEIISVLVGAPSPSIFASTLSSLNALFSLKEFRFVLRRINQAMELEQVRFVRKQGSRLPDWSSWSIRDFRQAAQLEQSLLSGLGMIEGYSKGAENIFDDVAGLIAKKKSQTSSLRSNLDDSAAMFAGGLENAGVYSMYAKSLGSQGVKSELKSATGGAGHELSFSAGLSIVAPYPGLSSLKEILQL